MDNIKHIKEMLFSLQNTIDKHLRPIDHVSNNAFEELVVSTSLLVSAVEEAKEAFEHVIDSTGGYTGGKPQEWLAKWGDELCTKLK